MRILPTKSSCIEPLNHLAGAPVCDRLLTLANPKAGSKPALRFVERRRNGRCMEREDRMNRIFRIPNFRIPDVIKARARAANPHSREVPLRASCPSC